MEDSENNQMEIEDQNEDSDLSDSEPEQKTSKEDNVITEKDLEEDKAYNELFQNNIESSTSAPLLVVVQGSEKSGKSTLINSICSHYMGHKISNIIGTVTINTTQTQRVTFIECPNDIQTMIDLSKVADLSLLIIDGSRGFEMESYEYMCLLKQNGMTNVMGVLTHLDFFKDNKSLRKTKKKYKQRFLIEAGKESKLFYLSGLQNNGQYPTREVLNLARFISLMKARHNDFQKEHPHLLVDRFEYDNSLLQKDIDANTKIDALFFGYMRGASYREKDKVHIVGLGDFDISQLEIQQDPCPVSIQKKAKKNKVGINTGQHNVFIGNEKLDQEGTKKKRTLNKKERQIYAPNTNLGFLNYDKSGGYITIPDDYIVFTKKDDEDETDLQEGVKIVRDLQQLRKGIDKHMNDDKDDIELLQGVNIEQQIQEERQDQFKQQDELIEINLKKQKFIKTAANIQYKLNKDDNKEYNQLIKEVNLQEFIYSTNDSISTFDSSRYEQTMPKVIYNYKKFFMAGNDIIEEEESEKEENLDQHLTEEFGMYKLGSYVKVTVKNVPLKVYNQFTPQKPIIITRNQSEDNFGFLKVRVQKHRWYNNVLKSRDPLIVSIGWRRYQTIPYFCVQDLDVRTRFIKYTPEHEYCQSVFYGNLVKQNTSVLCLQSLKHTVKKFRVAATGVVTEINHNFNIQKKLKIIGEPFKIYKNSAFIKGMFNSKIEVAKFEGAKIQTVSGIRGQIKKAATEGKEGSYRATFEDKILMSDIVFMKTWFNMPLEKFYNPVLDYQETRLMKTTWQLRKENNIELVQNKNSEYKEIIRPEKKFNELQIPKSLSKNLPFSTQEKVREVSKKQLIKQREDNLPVKQLMDDDEKKAFALIQRLNTIKKNKVIQKQKQVAESMKIKNARHEGEKKKFEQAKKDFQKMKTKKRFTNKSGKRGK